jgi:hypothetical protein
MLFRSMIYFDRWSTDENDVDHRLRLSRDEESGEGEVRSEASLRHEQDLKLNRQIFMQRGSLESQE